MDIMLGLCKVLDVILNPAICMVAIVELVLMFKSISIMSKFKHRIKLLNSKEITKTGKSRKEAKGEVTKTFELLSKKSWDEFDQFLKEYQEKDCWYSAFSLIIQIFTLLGILGTVAGLYIAMSNGQDMYEGVELALSTTVLGLLFAVLYKVADIIIMSVYINYIEDGINRYEKIYKVDSEDANLVEPFEEVPEEAFVEDLPNLEETGELP